ncbi:MAG TPA: metallophosphoesterase family protein [Gemmataceae bacterium]|jgi:putative phosphoesterase|nr:metallophosphoesterase family protein [Gemmataceae bacterium]
MRVAALYDIHGNLPALDAVLDEIRREKIDRIVIGGDVVPGPMPRETIARIHELKIPTQFIRGNGDREIVSWRRGVESEAIPKPYRETMRWVARQLRDEDEQWLASWPETLRLEFPAVGEVLFCHATPRNDTEVFTRLTPEESLMQVFAGVGARVVVCGHTHMQFDRTIGGIRVVNAGSVGMPYAEPGAYWLLLGPEVTLRHTKYDLARAAEVVRGTSYPQAEDFAANHILQPPSEARMLEAFTKLGLK